MDRDTEDEDDDEAADIDTAGPIAVADRLKKLASECCLLSVLADDFSFVFLFFEGEADGLELGLANAITLESILRFFIAGAPKDDISSFKSAPESASESISTVSISRLSEVTDDAPLFGRCCDWFVVEDKES